ncbi:class 3 lipase protein [Aphelenchoides avenae]|nr:class 3 lipase protein [Aphelenchus avenae]
MLPLSSAAFREDPSGCLRRKLPNVKVHRVYNVRCDTSSATWVNDTCQAYTAVSHADSAIIFSFRGSHGDMQIIHEIQGVIFHEQVRFFNMGLVSKYFYDSYNKIWTSGMHADLLVLRELYPSYQIWVTGASLGGAMASLGALAIRTVVGPTADIRLVTFGQPRTGNIAYALSHDLAIPYSFRVTHAHDIVPHVPPPIPSWYWHHMTEVWYPGEMGPGARYKVCEAQEDIDCSDSSVDLSTNDHEHYFDGYGC